MESISASLQLGESIFLCCKFWRMRYQFFIFFADLPLNVFSGMMVTTTIQRRCADHADATLI
jgi:hypothetical protein